MAAVNMEKYLRPDSVVVIGASNKKGAIGNTTVVNFKDLNFEGNVFCVNPKYTEIEGFPCYSKVTDIVGPIDVAIITTPAAGVEQAIIECGEKKIPFALIFTAGFAEMGKAGEEIQNRILAISKENNIRVLGPNTLGTFNIKDKVLLSFTSSSLVDWLTGEVGLIAQSGATGATVMNSAIEEGIGFTYMYTVGNQIDLTTVDLIDSMIEDQDTKIIAAYMEGVPDGQLFQKAALKALNNKKPLVIYKSGRSDEGQKAALSHTASLTGSNVAFELAAKKYGVSHVDSIESMITAIKGFNSGKYTTGKGVATVVISGALGIMIADYLSDIGQGYAVLSDVTKNRLKEQVPGYLPVENPVDIASTLILNPGIYKHCIETLVQAEEVDSIIVHLPLGVEMGGLKFAQDIIDVANTTSKPILAVTTGTEKSMGEVRKFLNKNRVPAFNELPRVIEALNYIVQFSEACQKEVEEAVVKSQETVSIDVSKVVMTEPSAKRLMQKIGVPIPNGVTVQWESELLEKTKSINYPVVAKIISPDITHKSDVGGVIMPINNSDELLQAYNTILENVSLHVPDAQIDGVLVEEMSSDKFLEAIVGITNDPSFGPIITCGLGGIYVEVMKDISQRLAPITELEATEMIEELKASPIFKGLRKGLVYDADSYGKVLVELSKLPSQLPNNWSEIEVNPMVVFEKGKGVMALDALITFENRDIKEAIQI